MSGTAHNPALWLANLSPRLETPTDEVMVGVVGTGVSHPEHEYAQSRLADWLIDHYEYSSRVADFVRRVHRRSGIRTRRSVLPDFGEGDRRYLFRSGIDPNIADRMAVFDEFAPALGARAARCALSRCRLDTHEVTHLILVTSTGFMTPGPDVAIGRLLGLDPRVERTVISMHGCAGGTTGLATAAQIARTDPDARVLIVCVEICSIHLGSGEGRQDIVANSLFADGASAAVVRQVEPGGGADAVLGQRRTTTIDGTEDVLSWTLLPSGFRLRLGRELPSRIRTALRSLPGRDAPEAVSPASPLPEAVRWIAHAGGVAVLEAVRRALELPSDALASASLTLERYGNVSSASVLYALHQELDTMCPVEPPKPAVLLAFGPGLCIDAIGCTLRGGHYWKRHWPMIADSRQDARGKVQEYQSSEGSNR